MPSITREEINSKLDAWAQHILQAIKPERPVALVGLIRHGDVLARRLLERMKQQGCEARYGALDISLYRDDFDLRSKKLALHSSYLPFSTDGMQVFLVDDVVYTGRTVRAALNALFEYGRPAVVQLHCLVDRRGRELPIEPDYAAFTMPKAERVEVHLQEIDGVDDIAY